MKHRFFTLAVVFGCAVVSRADGLNKDHIAPDAKWLIHIDCDNLRQTQVGDFLLNRALIPKATAMTGDLKINVSNVLAHVTSLTAYGTDFKKGPHVNGVLMINSDAETQKALEGLLVAQILANTNGPVKKLADEGQAMYSFANEVFVTPVQGGPIVISKSKSQIDAAREILAGKAPSLATSTNFGEFPLVANSFFVLGAAEVFNNLEGIPAQAKVLQMADGGRVALGERSDQVFLDLALRGKTAEVTHQIQQVIEGMVALVNLGQPDVPDVMDLAKSVKVSSLDRVVTVSLEYPSSKVIARLNDVMNPKPQPPKPPRKPKVKHQAKPAAPPEPAKPKPEADPDEKPLE